MSRPNKPLRRMRVERPGRYFRPLSQTIFCEGFCIFFVRKLFRAAAVPFPRSASNRLVSHEPCLVVRHSCYFRVSLTRSANRCCHQMLLGEYGLTSAPAQHSCGRAAVPRRGVLHTRKSGSSRGSYANRTAFSQHAAERCLPLLYCAVRIHLRYRQNA